MAHYDKYEPIAGGFRAPLNADLTGLDAAGQFGPKAVSINTSGKVVVGTAGASGLVGILVKNAPHQGWTSTTTGPYGSPNSAAPMGLKAGDIVDVMTHGELILDSDGDGVTGVGAGQPIYATAAGDLTNVATGNTKVGFMVEADRMVVRLGL
jgi:hypothetical protein